MRGKCVKRLLSFFGKNHLRRKFFYGRLTPVDCKLELIGKGAKQVIIAIKHYPSGGHFVVRRPRLRVDNRLYKMNGE